MNKKGSIKLFGFFFVLMIIASLFFFLTFGTHYILYDYGIDVTINAVNGTLLNASGTAMTNIGTLANDYIGLTGYYDLLFLVLIVSAFIESTIASIRSREDGFLSFFGFVTIGNLFLIFVLSYATQIQGWILNDLVFEVILVSADTPILTFFFNYSMYIGLFWYLWLITVKQIDLDSVKEKLPNIFNRNNLTSEEGRFEE